MPVCACENTTCDTHSWMAQLVVGMDRHVCVGQHVPHMSTWHVWWVRRMRMMYDIP